MPQKGITILFTDLDGTLLGPQKTVSANNLMCLQELGEKGTIRVIATGRSHYSFQRVISADFPVDFLIFSSGAGIIDLTTGEILNSHNLTTQDIASISKKLDHLQADYMVHHPVPENHRFIYRRHTRHNPDFDRRLAMYQGFTNEFNGQASWPKAAAQVIAILPPGSRQLDSIKDTLSDYQVTRTTSPLDHNSIWLEIYPENVHKGSAASWLCRYLEIEPSHSLGIGNDYNDLNLLEFTAYSYLLANAPNELHHLHSVASAYDQDGFAEAVQRHL